MSLQSAVEVLMEIPLFRRIEPRRLRVIVMMSETLTYHAGERLFEKGEEGDAAYIVLDGVVEVRVPVTEGEKTVAELGQGEIFGEMAVLTDQPRSTAIAAKTDLTALRLERAAVLSLLREFPDIALELIRILARRLEVTTGQFAAARAELETRPPPE